jgi:predicted dithiol-disulfide oxidoreductase (DUF899 family)
MVSRAPLEKLEAWKAQHGWDHIPWYSSGESSFNHDFAVTVEPAQGARVYNYRDVGDDPDWPDPPYEMPGRSTFLRVGDRIFHTYSQYARGLESTGGSYYFLDLTALGRQEDWEEPKGRSESARAAQPDFAS